MNIVKPLQRWRACVLAITLSFWLATTPSYANEKQVLELEDAIALTLQRNPQLYQYSFIQQRLQSQRRTDDLSPALELGLDIENFSGSGKKRGMDGSETTLALSSVIEMSNKREARIAVTDTRMEVIEQERQATTLDVLGQVTTSYIKALATQQYIELSEEALKLSQDLYRTVEKRAKLGAATEAEVMRAKAAFIRAKIARNALLNTFERQKVTLGTLWNETNPLFDHLAGNLFAFGRTETFATLYTRAINSPTLQIFASKARLKDAEIKLAESKNSSDLTWRVGIRQFKETGDSGYIAGISLPLFSKKRNAGNVGVALAERNAVDYERQDVQLVLHSRLFEAYSLRQLNITSLEILQNESIPALQKALRLTRAAYENGRYRYQDWVVAQEELLSTQQSLIESATNALLNQALIEQLTGQALTQ